MIAKVRLRSAGKKEGHKDLHFSRGRRKFMRTGVSCCERGNGWAAKKSTNISCILVLGNLADLGIACEPEGDLLGKKKSVMLSRK